MSGLPNHLGLPFLHKHLHMRGTLRDRVPPFSNMKFSQSPYVFQRKMCLSKEPDATTSPLGLNFIVNTSPAWPVSSMMGACSRDVRLMPYT